MDNGIDKPGKAETAARIVGAAIRGIPGLIRFLGHQLVHNKTRMAAVAAGIVTIVLVIGYVVERGEVHQAAKDHQSALLDALEARLEVLVEAKRLQLLATKYPVDEEAGVNIIIVSERLVIPARKVADRNLYTTVFEEEEPAILVGVKTETGPFMFDRLPLAPVIDAMREHHPGKGGGVYLTTVAGRPVLRWPDEEHRPATTEHRKFRQSSLAFDRVGAGESGTDVYRNLDDRDTVGAFRFSEVLHGGIVVEQDQRVAFAAIRGLQPWHVSGSIFLLLLLVVVARMLVPRAKFTEDLFRLYEYAKRYWFLIALTILFMAAYAGGNMVRLTLVKTLADDVLLGKGAGALQALVWVLTVFAVIVVVMAAASWFKEYLSEYVTQAIVNDLRVSVAAHLVTQEMSYFDRQRAGDLMSRLSNDVGATRKSLSLLFGEFFQEPLMLVGAIGAAFITNWRLTLAIALGFPLIVMPILRLGRLVKRYSKRRQVQRGVVTEVMMQTVTGIRTVKAFQMEDHEIEKLRQASRRLLLQSVRVARTTALSKTFIEFVNQVAGLLVLAIGGYMVIHGIAGASPGDLIALSVILGHVYKPTKNLTKTYNKIQESLAGAERIFEIMDHEPAMKDRPDALVLERPEREIAFEHVSFAYDETPVLKDLSFRVRVGEVVALVGETGAGKSTVTDLVARFYDPTEGRVTIDGVDLRDYKIRSLRKNTSTVSQDAFLFNSSVMENLRYGHPGATDEEIYEAAKAAGIHEEILEMDRGYRTPVGERGSRLSGGQVQRLTIARAILKDAAILILDEATSALDSQTESEVQDALNSLMQDRTTFIIAHRLSTIAHADRILVLREGELVEQGTHEELMDMEDGVYRSLHTIQFATASITNGDS